MSHEVLVVGGGIGGLTAAALLAARGLDVCLIERESHTGGCAAPFELMSMNFEPGAGLYTGWGAGEIHERVFSELKIAPPEIRLRRPPYAVRLPCGNDITIESDDEVFFSTLARAFPESAVEAAGFYRALTILAHEQNLFASGDQLSVAPSRGARLKLFLSASLQRRQIKAAAQQSLASLLTNTSPRFRRFVDAQLRLLIGLASDRCSSVSAARALISQARSGGIYEICGGSIEMIKILITALREKGATVRCNAAARRFVYDARGNISGAELMTGEILSATRATISNLTVWDTYAKLVGHDRTPAELRTRLKEMSGRGCYLLFLAMDEAAVKRLPTDCLLTLFDRTQTGDEEALSPTEFIFRIAPERKDASDGRRAVTVSTYTEAERWFAFQDDESTHEVMDHIALESWWERIHRALPELGDGVELIETATPHTYYERTRRKLGMVGRPYVSDLLRGEELRRLSGIGNLYLVGDTVFPGQGIEAVTRSALLAADEIAPPS